MWSKKKNKEKPKYTGILPGMIKGAPDWWHRVKDLFKKKTGGTIDEDDPEYDAQKIYQRWINSFR